MAASGTFGILRMFFIVKIVVDLVFFEKVPTGNPLTKINFGKKWFIYFSLFFYFFLKYKKS